MQKAIYTTVGIDKLLSHVQALKGVGARFVQMHAERNVDDGSYRLVYTFINVRAAQEHIAQDGSYAIENLVVEGIDQYQEIPSISSYYPAVFPFENEAHDLFGLAITDMQIDFKGFFYQVSTAEPMSVITPEVKAAREKAMKVRAAAEAKARGETRATVSMERAARLEGPLVLAIGNAPTALVRACELIGAGELKPALVIGVPVGFVNVVESKELLLTLDVPYIVARGRKGGSNVAAAICNAMLYQASNNARE